MSNRNLNIIIIVLLLAIGWNDLMALFQRFTG